MTIMNKYLLFGLTAALTTVGCGSDSTSFSVLPDGNTFLQNSQSSNTRIDILWVVDNSGSMATSQANLAQNFPQFIDGFTQKNLDFQIAVTSSDSFVALPSMASIYNNNRTTIFSGFATQQDLGKFRDGAGSQHTGVHVINQLTPNLESVFVTNVTQGINGWGDERPLQSMRTSLESPLNAGFVRQGAFLAVILVTDEDDFSHDGTSYLNGQYTNTALHTINSYVSFLDQVTGSAPDRRRYSVSSIAINDQTCLNQLNTTFTGRRIGQRVGALADATGGMKASLCGNFGAELELIADNIIELSTQFYLSRIPIPETIQVWVNDELVPNVANSSTGGWYYNATTNSIMFQGSYIPPQGARIRVNFDPVSLGG